MIALISDVHSNLPALDAVLADIEGVGCSRIWCLGDTTGYGAHPAECVDLVLERCEVVLAGNHDLAVVDHPAASAARVPGMWQGGPGSGIAHARAMLDEPRLARLRELEPSRRLDHVDLFHASRRDPVWEYVRSPESATGHLTEQDLPLSAVGHTHVPALWELAAGEAQAVGGHMRDGMTRELGAGVRRVCNPGSVGQPRDRDPRASWALLDRGCLSFHRVTYDVQRAVAAVQAAGIAAENGERLVLGW